MNLPELIVSPNPTPRLLTIALPQALHNTQASYEVRDMNQNIVLAGQCNSEQLVLDFAGFADGYYLLSIGNEELRLVEKVVKLSPGK